MPRAPSQLRLSLFADHTAGMWPCAIMISLTRLRIAPPHKCRILGLDRQDCSVQASMSESSVTHSLLVYLQPGIAR
jgi:hypothetical protein